SDSVGEFEGRYEPLIAGEQVDAAAAEARRLVDVGVPVAQVDRPFGQEAEGHASIPVEVAVAVAGDVVDVHGLVAGGLLPTQKSAEARRPLAVQRGKLREDLREGGLRRPHAARLILILRRIENGDTDGAILPDL